MARSQGKPRSPLKIVFLVVGAMLLVFVLAIGTTMFISWRLASQPPEWWRPVNSADPTVDTAARRVENSISDQVHRVRPSAEAGAGEGAAPGSATWTLVIKEAEANAWLAARLEDWLLNRSERVVWPTGASMPQVSFADGLVRLGFEIKQGASAKGRVLSVAMRPSIDAQGALWLTLESLSVGRFPVPGGTVAQGGSMLEGRLPPEMKENPDTARFLKAISGTAPLTDKAVTKLSDGRRVQILRITPKPGEVEFECRTLPRE